MEKVKKRNVQKGDLRRKRRKKKRKMMKRRRREEERGTFGLL